MGQLDSLWQWRPADVENWKVAMTLRGHTADVEDLNWSSDNSILASGSLDNTIHVRNMSNQSAPDPLLSPFLCSTSISDGNQQNKCSSVNASFASDMKSIVPSTPCLASIGFSFL